MLLWLFVGDTVGLCVCACVMVLFVFVSVLVSCVCQSVCLPVFLSLCLSVRLSVFLPAFPLVCLCAWCVQRLHTASVCLFPLAPPTVTVTPPPRRRRFLHTLRRDTGLTIAPPAPPVRVKKQARS